jgi:hypothetical protein
MSTASNSYLDFVRAQSRLNPCLESLTQFLAQPRPNRSRGTTRVHCVEVGPDSTTIFETGIIDVILESRSCQPGRAEAEVLGYVLIIEDIGPDAVELLGSELDIDPLFFCSHINTSMPTKKENTPLPPALALFPSQLKFKESLHIHSQRVFEFDKSKDFSKAPYHSLLEGHYSRNIRHLPPLTREQTALVRSCCSVTLKRFDERPWLGRRQS